MKKALETIGFIITVMGISGLIDHLWRQPIMGAVLNFFNREIFAKVDWLSPYALVANLCVILIGVVLLLIADRRPASG